MNKKPTKLKPFKHDPRCRLLIAATCAIGIECKHGHDVCPMCDPCECGQKARRRK